MIREKRKAELVARLEELSKYEKDWDTRGSEPPSEIALTMARKELDRIGNTSLFSFPDRIDPTPDEGAVFFYYVGEGKGKDKANVSFEFHTDGEVLISMSLTRDKKIVWIGAHKEELEY